MPRALILGGGLAGMAAALQLRNAGVEVELWEARSRLGGRAGSFVDQSTGHTVDYCQHVGMGCCTHLLNFLSETKTLKDWRRHRKLHFFGPNGKHVPLQASRFLPAPLHLQQLLWRWPGLTWGQRWEVARAVWCLIRLTPNQELDTRSALEFLVKAKQSAGAIERFWATIMVSALGESLDQVALGPMRKVIVEGFLASRTAYEVLVPEQPLRILFGDRVAAHLLERSVELHTNRSARGLVFQDNRCIGAITASGIVSNADMVIVAMPWFHLHGLAQGDCPSEVKAVFQAAGRLVASPITGVHLWWDRCWLDQPHAAIVGRLPQWVFRSPWLENEDRSLTWQQSSQRSYHYQVVISASRTLPRESEKLTDQVVEELRELFPACRSAKLLRSRVVTDPSSVYSVTPESSGYRPKVDTLSAKHHLALAGDWTATGWPATMEGAIRSGNMAAQACCTQLGITPLELPADLSKGWLARYLM